MNNRLFTKAAMITTFFVMALAPLASAHPMPTPTPTVTPQPGRMTGGGSIQCGDFGRVTHGFELHCFADGVIEPNNLEINWGGGNNFH